MIINNGERKRLIIAGVFDGICGVSRGLVAFLPNRVGTPPELARGGLLDGDPIMLTEVQRAGEGPSYTARFQVLS
jgi:hypothetical protein